MAPLPSRSVWLHRLFIFLLILATLVLLLRSTNSASIGGFWTKSPVKRPLRVETDNASKLIYSQDQKTSPFANFESWIKQYLAAGSLDSLRASGTELAMMRKTALKELILSDPARALAVAIDPAVRRKLPSEIDQYLEDHISSYGDYFVGVADEIDPNSGALIRARTERMVMIRGRVYRAHVYGRMLDMTSKRNIPINGIVLDGVMAISDSPVRTLSPGELAKLSAGGQLEKGQVAVDVGGEIRYFRNQADLFAFKQALISRQMIIGPDTAENESRSAEGTPPVTADSAWTEGAKTVLFIRIDFSDLPGEPISTSAAQSLINTDVNTYFRDNSYDKTSLSAAAVTPVLRMPQTAAYYGGLGNSGAIFVAIMTDARAVAKAGNFDTANFDLDLVGFKNIPQLGFGGFGWIGAKGAVLNGYFGASLTEHELGHNYGLNHANLWRTTDNSVIGPGSSIEYGDSFDVMGQGYTTTDHFNNSYKHILNWLTPTDTQTITATGTYQLQASDFRNATGIRGLRIIKDATTSYWIEFRQATTSNAYLMNGALIRWRNETNDRTNLLDMTPGSAAGLYDAALPIGKTFSDSAVGISITPLQTIGSAPQSLQLNITLTKFSISGRISAAGGSGISGVTMNLSGSQSASALSDSNGNYTFFGIPANGNYTVSPSALGSCYTFNPQNATFNNLSASQTANFTALSQPCSISGKVTVGASGLSGATMYLFRYINGVYSNTLTSTTDSGGNYSFTGLDPTNGYYLLPTKAAYVFSPDHEAFWEGLLSGQTVNFSATLQSYTISGKITKSDGTAISGVTIALGGASSAQATTDANGNYSFGQKAGAADYTLTPSKTGFSFSPTSYSYFYLASDWVVNFTGVQQGITIQTNPAGLAFSVDGTTYTTPQTFSWTPGSNHTISTSSTHNGSAGTRYLWSNWSDGGLIAHTITTPPNSTTYTASFTTQHFLTMNAGVGGTVSPSSGWYNKGTGLGISATPNVGFNFSGWTGSGLGSFTGATNAANIAINGPITQTASFVDSSKQVQFSAATHSLSEAGQQLNINVIRTGDTSGAATVNYATSDVTATDRSDYLAALGTLRFAAGETSKSIAVYVVNDAYGELAETFKITLSNPVQCVLGSLAAVTVTINSDESVNGLNPVKDASFNTDFFVRQHYLDFFNREADAGGLAFWKNQIDECTTQSCREVRRINVSAAFFVSIEFQETGYLVYKAYQAAFNSGEFLELRDFLPDLQEIGRGVVFGQPGADAQLEANKVAFFNSFVQRPAFVAAGNYPTTMTAAQFVDKVDANTFNPQVPGSTGALTLAQRNALVAQLAPNPSSPTLRAQVLRAVAQNSIFSTRQFNKAFVLMQYFGYLRRNPNDPPEAGLDFGGYNFWLSKLNQFNGNYIQAEMVNAFILSSEYQQRFGP